MVYQPFVIFTTKAFCGKTRILLTNLILGRPRNFSDLPLPRRTYFYPLKIKALINLDWHGNKYFPMMVNDTPLSRKCRHLT